MYEYVSVNVYDVLVSILHQHTSNSTTASGQLINLEYILVEHNILDSHYIYTKTTF